MIYDPKNIPSASQCKKRAVRLLCERSEFERSRLEKRMSSDDRYYSLGMLDEAQIWATLATVPEPVEYSTAELISAPALGAQFPTLVCPHGMVARLIPMGSEKVDGVDFPTSLRYSWTDCEICP